MIEILFYAQMTLGFWLLYRAVTDYLHTRRLEALREEKNEFTVSEYFGIAVKKSEVKSVGYSNDELTVIFLDGRSFTDVAEDLIKQPCGVDFALRQDQLRTKREREAKEFMQRFND